MNAGLQELRTRIKDAELVLVGLGEGFQYDWGAREMNDEEAFDAMITENLQRKDVDPMEEAYAFSQLVKNGKTVEEVAMRFGKSIRFVNDRIKLNNLIPELMLAVKDDK